MNKPIQELTEQELQSTFYQISIQNTINSNMLSQLLGEMTRRQQTRPQQAPVVLPKLQKKEPEVITGSL